MKRLSVVLIICLAFLLITVIPASSASNPFVGNWKAIDVDGSNVTLWIVAEGRSNDTIYNLRAYDNRTGAFWCGGPGEMNAVGIRHGENNISVSAVWWCLLPGNNNTGFLGPGDWTYDPVTDTIYDGTITYYRTP
jgi:hypothetical protein